MVFVGRGADLGAIGAGAYGEDPALGVIYGMLTAISYALFLLILRQGNSDLRRPAGPLFDATLSGAVFSALGGLAVGDLDWVPDLEAQGWLVLLALSSQVLGWLLISVSLPRLPGGAHLDPAHAPAGEHGVPRRAAALRGARRRSS